MGSGLVQGAGAILTPKQSHVEARFMLGPRLSEGCVCFGSNLQGGGRVVGDGRYQQRRGVGTARQLAAGPTVTDDLQRLFNVGKDRTNNGQKEFGRTLGTSPSKE